MITKHRFSKKCFHNKSKKYQEIEYSDDENDDLKEEKHVENRHIVLSCLYINNVRKWKPYFKTKYQPDSYSKIKETEKKYMHICRT